MKLVKPSVPKVVCPKCREEHDLNPQNTCPYCHTHYTLVKKQPSETQKTPVRSAGDLFAAVRAFFSGMNRRAKKLLVLIAALLAVFLVFLAVCLTVFSDKEPLLYGSGKVKDQPLFYAQDDDTLFCLFPNGKSVPIGTGELLSYTASEDGKNIILQFEGSLSGSSKAQRAYYVLRLKNRKKVVELLSREDGAIPALAGGNGEYLYYLVPTEDGFSELYLLREGKAAERIADGVLSDSFCVSPNGRYALFRVDESGGSKLLKYSVKTGACTSPGIKNAYPLSVDNKGEYLIYAKRTDNKSIDIIAEKTTSDRIDIPLALEAPVTALILSRDRRSFAIEYADRTTYCTCGSGYYSTVLTDSRSRFGYAIDENACYNLLSVNEIPQVLNAKTASLLPYSFFDSERQGLYCVGSDGSKTPVFDRTFDSVKVADNGNVAFVSDGKLFSGRLNPHANKLCEIMPFEGLTLCDISSDGRYIYYADADGNLFSVRTGKAGAEPVKVFVDADFIKFAAKGDTMLITGDGVTSFLVNGKVSPLASGILPESTFVYKDDLSNIVYAAYVYDGGDKTDSVRLYQYRKGKSVRICDDFGKLYGTERARIDRTTSYFAHVEEAPEEEPEKDALGAPANASANASASAA